MSALYGLKARLAGMNCKCGHPIATIHRPAGPHHADLICDDCGAQRGEISERTAKILKGIVERWGAPTTPLILRRP
jgi:hypothetical protein